MIVKKFSALEPRAPHLKAGWAAEKQMAFYIDRAFGKRDDVRVFHGVRYDRGGDVAQIDHLVLHAFGLAVIESKSMVGRLSVNVHGEFTRDAGKSEVGIDSPVQQGKRQIGVLADLLNDRKTELRRKFLTGQAHFREDRFRCFVAISGHSVIDRRDGADPPELFKADQVTDAIDSHIKAHRGLQGLQGFVKYTLSKKTEVEPLLPFTDTEMESIAFCLLQQDTSRRTPRAEKPVATATDRTYAKRLSQPQRVRENTAPPLSSRRKPTLKPSLIAPPAANVFERNHRCSKCESTHLEIRYGRNYYFKCLDCEGNTAIKQECPACGKKARLKKTKLEFRWNCGECDSSEIFYVNR